MMTTIEETPSPDGVTEGQRINQRSNDGRHVVKSIVYNDGTQSFAWYPFISPTAGTGGVAFDSQPLLDRISDLETSRATNESVAARATKTDFDNAVLRVNALELLPQSNKLLIFSNAAERDAYPSISNGLLTGTVTGEWRERVGNSWASLTKSQVIKRIDHAFGTVSATDGAALVDTPGRAIIPYTQISGTVA